MPRINNPKPPKRASVCHSSLVASRFSFSTIFSVRIASMMSSRPLTRMPAWPGGNCMLLGNESSSP